MLTIFVTIVVGFVVIGAFLIYSRSRKQDRGQTVSLSASGKKPVVMIVIDSLMDAPLREAMQIGKAPAMKFLAEHGTYHPRLVSPFPTMSVCIDTTLLTGELPNRHKIFGLTYFHPGENRVINFGTGLKETLALGVKAVLTDGLQRLNQKLISPDVRTIHEEFDGPTGSINALVYRGKRNTILRLPLLASLIGMPLSIQTTAPEIFSFGSLSRIDEKSSPAGPLTRYGLNDTFSRKELVSLIRSGNLPPFTIVYFPKNDDALHQKGPSYIEGIERADRELQEILHAFPTWEDAIRSITFIVLGDGGQAKIIPNRKEAYIDLRKLLKDWKIMPIRRKSPKPGDEIVLCVNERMAYVYPVADSPACEEIVRALKQEPKLDVIAWKEDGWISVVSGQTEGKLQYKPGGRFHDEYGQTWELIGDLPVLDLTVDEEGRIEYGVFPDVMNRLLGVMETAERVVVVTVSPGYELVGESSPRHKGGSHGSLHHLDSISPMIVCGTDTSPDTLRIVDLKKWILKLISPST
jgi:hypothetical protein